jgi:hypothetical protein
MMKMKKQARQQGEARMASDSAHRARSSARRANAHTIDRANFVDSSVYECLGPGIHLAYALHIPNA